MHIFENFYFFSTNLYFLKIGHLLFRAQYFRFHFGAKCVRSFFHFCKLVIIEQIDESDRDDGLSFLKLKRKNKKSMCAASKRAVTASYLLVWHQCHKQQSNSLAKFQALDFESKNSIGWKNSASQDLATDPPSLTVPASFLTEHSLTERSQSQISKQHNEMEFFRMTFWLYEDFAK